MAYYYIDGKIHDVRRAKTGTCTKCGGNVSDGWKVSLWLGFRKDNKEVARYCRACTNGIRDAVSNTHIETLATERAIT